MNLNSVLIGSEDPKRLTDYYTKLFGKPGMEDGGYAGWQIGNGWITVGPHDQVKGRNAQPGVCGSKSSPLQPQCRTRMTVPDCSRTLAVSRLMRSTTPQKSCLGSPL